MASVRALPRGGRARVRQVPRRYRRRMLTTAQRGLGGGHQSARQVALAALRDGDLCARCEARGVAHPMYRWAVTVSPRTGRLVAPLLDLDDFPGRRFGGPQVKRLSWRRCNRRAGQQVTTQINRLRATAADPRRPVYDRW